MSTAYAPIAATIPAGLAKDYQQLGEQTRRSDCLGKYPSLDCR
jgi:hypothetical protein